MQRCLGVLQVTFEQRVEVSNQVQDAPEVRIEDAYGPSSREGVQVLPHALADVLRILSDKAERNAHRRSFGTEGDVNRILVLKIVLLQRRERSAYPGTQLEIDVVDRLFVGNEARHRRMLVEQRRR